ncbi:hypothetical protein [Longispora fulva]
MSAPAVAVGEYRRLSWPAAAAQMLLPVRGTAMRISATNLDMSRLRSLA